MDNYIDIITSFAFFEGLDENPIRQALKSHNSNALIKNIYVISESLKGELEHLLNDLDDLTIHFVEVKDRPTFHDLISYANTLLENDSSDYVALVNGDVSFENETAVMNAVGVFNKKNVMPNTVLALSRHEYINGKVEMALDLDNGLSNFISADAWVFNRPCHNKFDAFYYMGQMNCDLMLAYDLSESGYQLINSCLDTVIVHHEDELKADGFYAELNSRESTVNAMHYQMGSRVNLEYTVSAVPWVKSKWLEYDYNPQNYKFNNAETIWLILNNNTENLIEQLSVKVLEVISSNYKKQLNILVEGEISDILIRYHQRALALNRQIVFHRIDNFDSFISNALSGRMTWSDSFVLLSDTSRLTKNILIGHSELILDLRGISKLEIHDQELLGIDIGWCLSERYGGNIRAQLDIITYENHKCTRMCSLITSVYKSDEFIDTFIDNCQSLTSYEDIDHYYIISNLSSNEKETFSQVLLKNRNVVFVWHREDPGLYECWNRGIKLAITEYVSNANVDDLRDANHVERLLYNLTSNEKYSFAASALHPFYEFSGNLESHKVKSPWYSDQQGSIEFRNLGKAEKSEDGNYEIKPHNLPHCMPVWRKSLHDKYGYFDEGTYGTFADWAFWLKATLHDELGYLNGDGLGYYYVNLESHNRRGELLQLFHQRVEQEFLPHFLLSHEQYFQLHETTEQITKNKAEESNQPKKLNIHGIDLFYGEHRNSFNKLAEALLPLQTNEKGILFLPFIERYFVWGADPGEAGSDSPAELTQDWIGIIHVPCDAPKWFHSVVSPEVIFETDLWKKSLASCKGLITLSDDLKRDIEYYFPDLPIFSLKHPTEFDDLQTFELEKFNAKPTLVQAGDWLRNLQAIHRVKAEGYRRVMLKKAYTDAYLNNEIAEFGDFIDSAVETYTMVPNDEYDTLLSTSVVICWLHATAANNLILECIARQTPLIINPLPSVVEYLGEDYPLYIDHLCEAEALLENKQLIKEAHEYLASKYFRETYSYQRFFENFSQSEFYNKL
jgi:hypothetical protein